MCSSSLQALSRMRIEEACPEDAAGVDLFDFVMDFVKRNQLRSQEDQGMVHLLIFSDLISELQKPEVAAGGEQEFTADTEPIIASSVTDVKRDETTVTANQVTGLVKFTDVAALRPL